MLAYLIIHGSGLPILILNILFEVLLLVLVFFVVEWILSLVGIVIPDRIRKILLAIFVLVLLLSFFTGCSSYQSTVSSRKVSAGYNSDGTIGFSDKVIYR